MYQHHPMFPLTANKYMPHIIALAEGDPCPEKLDTSKLRLGDVVATVLYRLDCQFPGILKRFYGTEQKEESGLVQALGASQKQEKFGGRRRPHLLITRNKNQVLV
jgi:hypothetical protein